LKKVKFEELFNFLPKSKRKAGTGLNDGLYPFYTSSDELKKFVNESEKADNKFKIWKEKVQVSDWNEVTDLLISNRGKLAEARKKAPINSQETPTPRTVMPQVSNSKATANEFGKPAIKVVVGESKKWIKTFEQFILNEHLISINFRVTFSTNFEKKQF
jgi:hypothetical protein